MENIQLPPEATQGQVSQEEAAQRAQQEEQLRRDLMATVLDPPARERRMSFRNPYHNMILNCLIGLSSIPNSPRQP